MERWEYFNLREKVGPLVGGATSERHRRALNDLGKQGWECYSVVAPGARPGEVIYFFRRRLDDEGTTTAR